MPFTFDFRALAAGLRPNHPGITLARQLATTHRMLATQSTDTVTTHKGASSAPITTKYRPFNRGTK